MPTVKPPKATLGYVDPYQYQSVFTDLLEHVPDLMFPTSVPVYARMRRDPQITAILQSWMLQLRRAQWQVDPAGCDPAVAKRIADDLGLHVVGDDQPGAARTRGVSWNEHLRSALGMLPFGFSGFELLADLSSGQARLAGLYERPQWTISHIHVDATTGDLQGITQDAAWKEGAPQIPADRLVWYANDREGANWAGTSLLRSCYSSWFLKEEMKRVHGISNRRWGAGVATMKANPGTMPSTPEMMQAMELTSAMRAGETAGAAVPPGFTLDIMGLSGSVPDTLGFIKWLDQQMSRSALMGMLDLGETPNGSRALGETFVDAFLLALEAAAEHVADVATRQIAARLVDWNEGDTEAVPRIVVAGVGSRREVTAQSLQLLLTSGALAADPALEAWVRREYRLPERDPDAPPAPTATKGAPGQPSGADANQRPTRPDPVADAEPTPVAAAAKPRSRTSRKKTAQPALFGDDESDAARIQQQWDQAKDKLLKRWPKLAGPMVAELADQAEAAVTAGEVAQLGELAVSAGVIAAIATPLRGSGSDLAQQAAAGVVQEAAGQGVNVTAPELPGAERIRQHADVITRVIANGYASGAAKTGLQLAGASPQDVRAEVARHLTDVGTSTNGLVGENLGALLSAAQFAGRLAVLEQHPASSYQSVEINDRNECAACADVSGTIYTSLADALADYPLSGSFRACLGGSRCRGYVKPQW